MLKDYPAVTTIPCTNLDSCRTWYQETLGLDPIDAEVPGGVLFNCGDNTQVLLYESSAPHSAHTLATFLVVDLDSEVAELRNHGTVFEEYGLPELKTENGIHDYGNGRRTAWFKDPEGNILAVSELKTIAKAA